MTSPACLPDGWSITTLGEAAKYQNGRAFKPTEWKATGLPIIRIQNLNDSGAPFNLSDQRHEDRFVVANGDLLFAWSASLGAYLWRGGQAWLNQHIFRVDHSTEIDRKFLYFALKNLVAELYAKAHGSGMVHVTKKRFEETPLRLPPFNEQRRIVERIEALFDEIDRGVESLHDAKRALELYRQSLLKSAFEGHLTVQWRAKNPDKLEAPGVLLARVTEQRHRAYRLALRRWERAHRHWIEKGRLGKRPTKPKAPKRYHRGRVRLALPDLPHGWAWSRLGCSSAGPEYGTAAKSNTQGDVPVVRMGNIRNGRIDWRDLAFTSDKEEIARYSLQPGDVLFNRTNSPELVGKTAIYRGERPALFAGYLVRVNQINAVASGPYVAHFLTSPRAREYGKSVKTDGVNQSNINATKLQQYPFPLCSTAEQTEIVRILDARMEAAESLGAEIDASLTRADALRQSILQRAFSGQLVPQDPTDEPASALLARLRSERDKVPSKRSRKRAAQ